MSTTHLTIHDLLRITYTYEAQALQAQARKRSDSACFVRITHYPHLLRESEDQILITSKDPRNMRPPRTTNIPITELRNAGNGFHGFLYWTREVKTSLSDLSLP
jgi:hypothetical protein